MAKREMPKLKVAEEATIMGPIFVDPIPVTPEPEPVEGVVKGCIKLNIRENPDIEANILCEVKAGSKLMIDLDKSTKEWLSVCTETGIEGFCMKKFVAVK